MSTRRDGQQRRQTLLDAALICFARHGVLGAGIETIRQEAGASPSSVYHLFPAGLPDLTAALLERTFCELFESLAQALHGKRSARTAVAALVLGHLEWVLAHRERARLMYEATGLQYPPDVQARLIATKATALAPVLEQLAPFLTRGELPRWPVELLDVVLLGATHEACRRLLAGAELDVAWLRAHLPELAWRSIQRAGG